MTDQDEPLMHLRPQNDFERLLWANRRIKELEAELAEASSTITKLTDQIEEITEVLKSNSKQLHLQVISLKSERNKLKVSLDDLLYKHSLLQIQKNITDF